jgi:AAT family amino acid transporter
MSHTTSGSFGVYAEELMFSLSRANYAPSYFGKVNKRGVPIAALAVSTIGIAIATIIYMIIPEQAFMVMMGISMFGAMFAWFMIFVTHIFFRLKWDKSGGRKLPVRMIGFPFLTILGGTLLGILVLTTWFMPAFKSTLEFGIPWLILISVAYFFWKKANASAPIKPQSSKNKPI